MSDNPASVLFNTDSIELSVTASVAIPASASALIAAGVGSDGIVRYHKIDSSGFLHVSMSLPTTINVQGSQLSGSVSFGNPLLFAGTDGTALRTVLTDGSGRIVNTQKAYSSSITPISASASAIQLLAANPQRLGATLYNDTDTDMYVALGNTLTTSSYSVKVGVTQYYEVPSGYTGILYAIWDTGPEGYAQVTEIV